MTDVKAFQGYVLAAVNVPSLSAHAQQAYVAAAAEYEVDVSAQQAYVLVAIKRRSFNPTIRAWTYTMDGHDFYVLHLGDTETLVVDLSTEQWSQWSSPDLTRWRLSHGINWTGAVNYANTYGSNVLMGDDTLGVMWLLDPSQGYDHDPEDGAETPGYFRRLAMGQLVIRQSPGVPCHEVYLTGSFGEPGLTGDGVTLYTSDDAGHNFTDEGTITAETGEYDQRFCWSSLGTMGAPGRLFRVEDYGAVARIDALDADIGADR